MQHRSRAIILKRVAYGEADWIVTLFARDRGRLTGMAKSARASKRRFAGAFEPGAVVDLRYTERRGSDLVRLDEAQVAFPINGLLKSLDRIGAVSRTIRLALAFLQEHEANPAKFDLMLRRIMALNEGEPDPFETAAFELRWLALCGYAPVLTECAMCGQAAEAGASSWRFSHEKGGLVCSRCAWGGSASAIDDSALCGLVSLSREGEPSDALSSTAAGSVLSRYIDHVLGKPLASPVF